LATNLSAEVNPGTHFPVRQTANTAAMERPRAEFQAKRGSSGNRKYEEYRALDPIMPKHIPQEKSSVAYQIQEGSSGKTATERLHNVSLPYRSTTAKLQPNSRKFSRFAKISLANRVRV
jgi:hypothetical protein